MNRTDRTHYPVEFIFRGGGHTMSRVSAILSPLVINIMEENKSGNGEIGRTGIGVGCNLGWG